MASWAVDPIPPGHGEHEAPEDEDDSGVLGDCGCIDYHYADCPLRTGWYPDWSGPDTDDDYYDDHPPDGYGY